MVSSRILIRFAVLPLLILAGCQTWISGGATYTAKDKAYSVPVPAGWHYATRLGPAVLATRDGLALQTVAVEGKALDKALANSKRTLTPGMAPYELAEVVLDDLRSNRDLTGLEVIANEPAAVGGQGGFKVTLAYRTADRLRLSETLYGVIHGGKLWTLRYTAPTRHYHARDLATFEEMVAGFRFGA
jgi:hypothetical protein